MMSFLSEFKGVRARATPIGVRVSHADRAAAHRRRHRERCHRRAIAAPGQHHIRAGHPHPAVNDDDHDVGTQPTPLLVMIFVHGPAGTSALSTNRQST
jgi:hypothetical protein